MLKKKKKRAAIPAQERVQASSLLHDLEFFLRDEHLFWSRLLSNGLFLHRCSRMLTPFNVSITQHPLVFRWYSPV